ncbi:MAG TPA: GNAT family N-acetyltransferase [Polyangium sp.]|nr:GNAT family N-acetyltransferase [Polyangium sp.]
MTTKKSHPNAHYFEKVPRLMTERLVLRGVEPGDIAAIVELSVYDGVFARNEVEAARTQAKIQADIANGECLHWLICLRDTREIAGSCSYHRGFAENVGEIGYTLKVAYRGRGIMTEAVNCIVAFGLNELKLDHIVAYTSPDNRASLAVLMRAGFFVDTSNPEQIKLIKRR